MAIFITIEVRTRYPMLDLTLFRNPAFNGVSAVAFSLSGGMFALFLYITIYFQGCSIIRRWRPASLPAADRPRFRRISCCGGALQPDGDPRPARDRPEPGRGRAALHARHLPTRSWTTLLVGFSVAGIGVGVTNPGIG